MTKTGLPNFYQPELITNTSGTEQIVGSIQQAHPLQHSTATTSTNEASDTPQSFQQYSALMRNAQPKTTLFVDQGQSYYLSGQPMTQNGELYGSPELQNGMVPTISPSFPMNSISSSESQNGFLQAQFQKSQPKQPHVYQQQPRESTYSNSMYGVVSNNKQYLKTRTNPAGSGLGNQQQNHGNNQQQQQQSLQHQITLPGGHVASGGHTNVAAMYSNPNTMNNQPPQLQMSYSPSVGSTNAITGPQMYSIQGAPPGMLLSVRNNAPMNGSQSNGSQISSRSQHSRSNSRDGGQPGDYPDVVRPKIATTYWETENTICYQVRSRKFLVSRREDTNFINGTKLLNVIGMTRGKRDGILKTEKVKNVVKVGSMNLKGVWIPFDRAYEIARNEGVDEILYPLFVKDIKTYYMREGHKLKSEENEDEDSLSSSGGSKMLNSHTPIEHMEDGISKQNLFREEYFDRAAKEEDLLHYGSTQSENRMNKSR
ncbi:Transcriptional regulator EFH1 [Spathaspora sp. JA1]|nr:Transcriptional regulator EFH1 [Spathaspora sp. JA1]